MSAPGSGRGLLPRVVVAIGVGTVANTVGLIIAFLLINASLDRLNEERIRNTQAACVRGSEQNRVILDFLGATGADAPMLKAASEFFPVRTEAECSDWTRRQVSARP